ncbi:hypothetical protein [Microbacterium sp. EST19A]|uniref:hypothetical protein n=1 Tax=Microbacterium sp. EST19A TaxID=2862681 RepID=UPI001CC11007|nr:hypothetical protein [Microbacterium sp. EST19A]
MRVNDVLSGVPFTAPELPDAENPFLHTELFVHAQVTRILVDVMTGTVGILFELRQVEHLPANTALLRVTGVAQQNWIATAMANEFTAWSISGARIHQRAGEFQFVAQCLPAGAVRVVGSAAEFILLEAAALPSAPPDYLNDPRELIRFGVADESTECEAVGVARSTQTEKV